MTLIELFAPKGTLSGEQRQHLSERLVTELVSGKGVPTDLLERGRAMTWLVIHEPEVWTEGGQPVDPHAAPRYVVRVSAPGGHFNDSMRAEVVARLTRVLAEVDEAPERLYREPHAWIHINELPDGNMGTLGQVMHTAEITKMIVTGQMPQAGSPADEPAADTVIDPICGMTVVLDETAITLEHEGTIYGFCNPGCRDIFAGQHKLVAAP